MENKTKTESQGAKQGGDVKYKNYESYLKEKQKREEEERDPVSEKIISGIINHVKNKEGSIESVAELLKNNKIDQIIVGGEKKPDPEALKIDPRSREKILTLKPDLDAYTALYLLNNFNKKPIEEIYNENSITSVVEKDGNGKDLIENKNGLKIFLDVSGNWLKVEKDADTTTIYIDHHGAGKREPTSGTKMMYEIMQKAEILKEKPEWLDKFVNFVNDVDNLSYLDKKDNKGRKIFNENYFRNSWPNSLYALAEKQIPFETLIELCESGKIKDPSVPFTMAELNGEIGNLKIGDSTIKDLCGKQREEVEKVLDNVKVAIKHNEKNGLNLNTQSLGKIIYHDYFKNYGKTNMIVDHLAFKATKAKNFDTYVSWNKQKNIFYINSLTPNLSKICEELNKADPECAIDVRGVMIFGKIKNLTEEQFLNTIDPNILKGSKLNTKEPEKKENKDKWTKEDEEKYQKALETIKSEQIKKESAQKRILEIDAEIEKIKNQENKKEDTTQELTKKEVLEEISRQDNKNERKNIVEAKSYSTDFIKKEIENIVLKIKEVKEIKSLNINGHGDNIEINATLGAKKFLVPVTVKIEAILKNENGKIKLDSYNLEAGILEPLIELVIKPKLNQISELIKEHIEKEEKQKVEKVWIENGELKAL